MSFIFDKLEIPDVILITPHLFNDERGYFFENFNHSIFKQNQINFNLPMAGFNKKFKILKYFFF